MTACLRLMRDGLVVVEVWAPRSRAVREMAHYAFMYGQDGPVQIVDVPLVKCALCGEMIEVGLEPDGCELRECPMQEHNR